VNTTISSSGIERRLAVEVGVLLDGGFVGAKKSAFPPTSWRRSAVTSRLTVVLPRPVGDRRDECVFVGRGVRELELVAAPLKEVVDEQGSVDAGGLSRHRRGASPPSA